MSWIESGDVFGGCQTQTCVGACYDKSLPIERRFRDRRSDEELRIEKSHSGDWMLLQVQKDAIDENRLFSGQEVRRSYVVIRNLSLLVKYMVDLR